MSSLVDVEEVSAAKGELLIPAVKHVNLALMLSSHSASWRDSLGTRSKEVSAGMVSLCYFGKPVRYELGNPVDFAVVLLRNEALEQVREETRQCLGAELQAQPVIEDPTLRHLMQILHREKQDGFQNGSFFLDGMATALASYFVRQYSITPRRAQVAMRDRRASPSEVAMISGFADQHHLARVFRRVTGLTPSSYRRSL